MHLPNILKSLEGKLSPDTPEVQKRITDTAEGLDADSLAAFVLKKFTGKGNANKDPVVGPEQKSDASPEINVPERAAGGRVVASNINTDPSEKQIKAGNYSKDHINVHGLSFAIENAKGHVRKGIGADGKPWKSVLPAHYGYIKGTEGADGDHVDVYLGPHIKSPFAYVINQIDLSSKDFDEHKVILGAGSLRQAMKLYEQAFSDGKGLHRIGSIHQTTIGQVKEWLKSGKTKKPFVK